MNYPISRCQAQVSMTLEQIVDIEKAFTEVEILKAKHVDLALQLATAQLDLKVITNALYVTREGDTYAWIELSPKDNPIEWEEFLLTVKRNKNV